jgi:hypothetical protein
MWFINNYPKSTKFNLIDNSELFIEGFRKIMLREKLIDNLPQALRLKINDYLNIDSYEEVSVLRTRNRLNIRTIANNKKLDLFINLELINNIRGINKFHKGVYENLRKDKVYISGGETISQRELKFRKNIRIGFKNIFLIFEFFFKRVFPKLPITKNIYFAVTRGHNRVLSKAENLGRKSSGGFKKLHSFNYENKNYIISKKIKSSSIKSKPSYG